VQEKAALGIDDRKSVSITTSNRVCNFSVDGASVDSNSRQAFIQAINMFLAGNLDNLGRGEQDILRNLLLTPTLGINIDQQTRISFENAIGINVNSIANCIRSFRSGSDTPFHTQYVFCQALAPNGAQAVGPVAVSGPGRVLEIGVVINDKNFLLFVPEPLVFLGRQGFQYR